MASTAVVEQLGGLGVGESKDVREKMDRLNAEAEKNWHNDQWRALMAQQVTESIMWGFQHENLLSLLTTVENVPFNGRSTVKETRGMRAYWTARGGYIEASTIHSEVMEVPRDMIGFHVWENEDKLMTNFAETQATLIDLGIQRMDAEVNLRVLRLMQAAVPSGNSSYIGGAFDLSALNQAIRDVADASYEFEGVTVVARRTMLDKIIDDLVGNNYAGFIPNTNEQLLAHGLLGTYRGANLVWLKNYKDDEDIPFFPANEMYVVGKDASKFAFWGGLMAREWTENENWYWHYLARRDFGGVVHRPTRLRRIVDTTVAP